MMNNKRILNHVTVTGVDDVTDLKEIARLAAEYPYAEFGVLLSRSQMSPKRMMHVGRFPSIEFLKELSVFSAGTENSIQFAGHLCGSWVREFLMGELPFAELVDFVDSNIWRVFSRLQINTHAQPHKHLADTLVTTVNELRHHQIIWQYDKVNYELLATTKSAGCTNIATLFDMSHGAGILPHCWPTQIDDIYCGYAGGLSPENLADQLAVIESVMGVGANPIWIDAETHLRSQYYNNDSDSQGYTVDYFDLKKVEVFLEAAKPWVLEERLK
jgi:phosphoribosylanthranilate isomerase